MGTITPRQFYLKKCLGTRSLGFQFNRQYWKQKNIENDSQDEEKTPSYATLENARIRM